MSIKIPSVEHGQIITSRELNYLLYPNGNILDVGDRDERLQELKVALFEQGYVSRVIPNGCLMILNGQETYEAIKNLHESDLFIAKEGELTEDMIFALIANIGQRVRVLSQIPTHNYTAGDNLRLRIEFEINRYSRLSDRLESELSKRGKNGPRISM